MANLKQPGFGLLPTRSLESEDHGSVEDNPWANNDQHNKIPSHSDLVTTTSMDHEQEEVKTQSKYNTTNQNIYQSMKLSEAKNNEGGETKTDEPVNTETQNQGEKHVSEGKKERMYKSSHNDTKGNINDYKPTCPVIYFERGTYENKQIFTIHCKKMDFMVDCFVNTAVITMEGEWQNKTKDRLNCVFALPTAGRVLDVTIKIGHIRVITTSIVPKDDAVDVIKEVKKKFAALKGKIEEQKATHITPEEANPYEQYVPDLFRCPFNNIYPGQRVKINIRYVETLDYYKKGYIVSLPTYFPPGTLVDNKTWDQVVKVRCRINSLVPNSKIDCWTHHIKKIDSDNGAIYVESGACKSLEEKNAYLSTNHHDINVTREGRDFEISYSVKSEKTQAHCVREVDEYDPDSGELCIFITPPATLSTTFGRAFFFLLDRSGSMVGEPFREATRALNRALDRLRPSDQFNVCAFDHRQVYYQPSLVPANKEMLTNCKTWITTYVPERGGCTMDAPINRALEELEKSDLLPFVVLITDGAVSNEREICEKIEANKKMRTRFLTLGLGSYCNWFFLKALAKMGRGFSDIVVYREQIYHKMDHLLRMANTPVLTDIEVGLKGDEIEIYPFPIPDLFIGAPVVIKARYTSTECPKKIAIRGFNPHGDQETITCKVETRNDIPIYLIDIQSEIAYMTADAWLKKSKKLEKKVIDVSCRKGMPSMFTDSILIGTNIFALMKWYYDMKQKMKELEHLDAEGMSIHRQRKIMAPFRNNKKFAMGMIAALAAGIFIVSQDNAKLIGAGGDADGGNWDWNMDWNIDIEIEWRSGGGDSGGGGGGDGVFDANFDACMDKISEYVETIQSLDFDNIDFSNIDISGLIEGIADIDFSALGDVLAMGVESFGDIQATLDNLPMLGGGGDIDLDIDECCEDCGDCDMDCDCDCDCIIM